MDNDERTGLVTLVDDEGLEHEFAIIDIFPLNQKRYAILVPVNYDSENESGEPDLAEDAYIFRIDEDEASGNETLVEVEDEAEWNEAAREWENRTENMDEDEDDLL